MFNTKDRCRCTLLENNDCPNVIISYNAASKITAQKLRQHLSAFLEEHLSDLIIEANIDHLEKAGALDQRK